MVYSNRQQASPNAASLWRGCFGNISREIQDEWEWRGGEKSDTQVLMNVLAVATGHNLRWMSLGGCSSMKRIVAGTQQDFRDSSSIHSEGNCFIDEASWISQ